MDAADIGIARNGNPTPGSTSGSEWDSFAVEVEEDGRFWHEQKRAPNIEEDRQICTNRINVG